VRYKFAFLIAVVVMASANPAFAESDYDSSYKQFAISNNYWLAPCLNDSLFASNDSLCDTSSLPSDIWYQPATTDVTAEIYFKPNGICTKGSTEQTAVQTNFFAKSAYKLGKGGIVSPFWSYGFTGDLIDDVVSEYWVKTSRNGSSSKWIKATKSLKLYPLAPRDPCSGISSYFDKPPRLFAWPIPKLAGNYKVEISWFSRARWRCSVYDPNGCSWKKSEFLPHFTVTVIVAKNSVKIGKMICDLPERSRSCQVSED
jgi:hypothetical protein